MRALIVLALIAALAGCATNGRKVTQAQLDQVVSGQTNRHDLVTLFGPPTSEIYNSDGTQVLGWGYAHIGFMGIGTEIQGVSMIVDADGTVSGYTRTSSAPLRGTPAIKPRSVMHASPASQPLTEKAYKDQQLQQLMQKSLPYEEYKKRYRQIMGE